MLICRLETYGKLELAHLHWFQPLGIGNGLFLPNFDKDHRLHWTIPNEVGWKRNQVEVLCRRNWGRKSCRLLLFRRMVPLPRHDSKQHHTGEKGNEIIKGGGCVSYVKAIETVAEGRKLGHRRVCHLNFTPGTFDFTGWHGHVGSAYWLAIFCTTVVFQCSRFSVGCQYTSSYSLSCSPFEPCWREKLKKIWKRDVQWSVTIFSWLTHLLPCWPVQE